MAGVIIAGSRRFPSFDIHEPKDWLDVEKFNKVYNLLCELIKELDVETVISGCCWGMDRLGEYWAKQNDKPIIYKPANWKQFGRAAGSIRNAEMAKIGDVLVCIYTEGSAGTLNMIKNMEKLGKPVFKKEISLG